MVVESGKPYTFAETQHLVKGGSLDSAVVRKGIVIGTQLGIKYIKTRRPNLLVVELIPLLNGDPQDDRFPEEMRLFRRYQYHSAALDVFLRGIVTNSQTGRYLSFQIETPLPILPARKLGMEL